MASYSALLDVIGKRIAFEGVFEQHGELHPKVFVDSCYLYRQVLSLRAMLLTS